ncbi:MAG: alpha/beta fold hydrolase [Phycisphaerales bacterium]|nr:alpha/beta fold hydrolase [Phycisphaerales bacterium]
MLLSAIVLSCAAIGDLQKMEHDGVTLAYSVSGSGPVCILPSPGWGPSAEYLRRTLGPLEDRFTMVYLDTRGTGASDRSQPLDEHKWTNFVDDIEALRQHLQAESIWVAGHSASGPQAMQYAMAYPEHVDGLLLLNTYHGNLPERQQDIQQRAMQRSEEPWFPEVMANMEKLATADDLTDETFSDALTGILPLYFTDQAAAKRAAVQLRASHPSAHAQKARQASGREAPMDFRPRLAQVTAPALVITGEDDFICSPVAARELHLALPNSKLLILEDVGHFPWMERPDDFFIEVDRHLDALQASGEWTPLFNGKDLTGWTPKIAGQPLGEDPFGTVRVEDGMIRVGYDDYDGQFDGRFLHLFYEKPMSRYRLRVEYRFHGDQAPGGPGWAWRNSGAMLHCQDPATMTVGQSFPVCIEGQFLGGDGTSPRTTGNLCTPGTHVVYDGKLDTRHCINSNSDTCHGDEWVMAEFEVDGGKVIRHYVNGELVMTYTNPQLDPGDGDAAKLITGDDLVLKEGWISLQGESHPIDFRRVEIKPLD